MTDFNALLQSLSRPRLLIRAARFGLADYKRERDLKRLMPSNTVPAPARALESLIEEEARVETTRQEGDAAYSVSRHIELLVAMMAEARLLPRTL
ncbi:MAG: DUF6477 family protein [Pseudomonadota bacterium]